ncbi:Uncharacterised protein [Yersinia pekkanenii]|uniref:Uncharacterized protein n=1 Tax=Yersinia pekkanenii TaxID=1288385 RepID=A0A0T9R601_9GAMM|nr:Uncharacterised protein [Yersinia pekkanenii]CRY65748.1 Uncharacterised protein [Yersinia pekkanenii]
MLANPRYGERYQHIHCWTVYILCVKYADNALAAVNPEFSREVFFIYESSGIQSEMPLIWFAEVYHQINGTPEYYFNKDMVQWHLNPKPSRRYRDWYSKDGSLSNDDDKKDEHYSSYL